MINDKSCMLDALCLTIDLPAYKAIQYLDHDGSERGFHSQEIIDVAQKHGYCVTEIQRNPVGIEPRTYCKIAINFPEGNEQRFIRHLKSSKGIVMGSIFNRPHAVVWDGLIATDPANNCHFPLVCNGKISEEFFIPIILLKLERHG